MQDCEPIVIAWNSTVAESEEAKLALAMKTWPVNGILRVRPMLKRWLGIVLFLTLSWVLYMLWWRTEGNGDRVMATLAAHPLLAGAGVCFGVVLAVLTVLGRHVRDRRLRASQLPVRFDAEGVSTGIQGQTETMHWKSFTGFVETERLLILRQEQTKGLYFPKRLFSGGIGIQATKECISRWRNAPPVTFTE